MLRRSPRVHHPLPASMITFEPQTPIAHRTRSCLKVSPLAASSQTFPSKFLQWWDASEVLHGNQWSPLALDVLDPDTFQSLEHCVFCRHPLMGPDWNTSYYNNLGCICQFIGVNPSNPAKQRVKGTNTLHAIRYDNIPLDRQKGIAF